MFQGIFTPVVIIGALGLLFGLGLAYASKKFAVEVDERVAQIREVLPGANCGACGQTGCDSYAEAVAEGLAAVNCCSVGGPEVAAKIAEIMGTERFPLWKEMVDEGQGMALADQILSGKPYELKAAACFGVNHRMYPDSKRFLEALDKLDFFFATDIFWSMHATTHAPQAMHRSIFKSSTYFFIPLLPP
jgi:hypothetical protein